MTYFDVHSHLKTEHAIYNSYTSLQQNFMFSVGVHPWLIGDIAFQLDALEKALKEGEPMAVGECGLDKACATNWALQVNVFRQQILMATQYSKPLIVHCVRAYQECLYELKAFEGNVLFHGFNKSKELLAQLVKRKNVFVSFGEKVFDANFSAVIEDCDLSKVFLETDNAGIDIEAVYVAFAQIRSVSVDELKEQIELNRKRFFC